MKTTFNKEALRRLSNKLKTVGVSTQMEIVLIPYDDPNIHGLQAVVFPIYEACYYGRSLARGLIVYQDVIWIVYKRRDNCWYLETKLHDVLRDKRGSKFVKWRNYLQRVNKWPWTNEYSQQILGMKKQIWS